MLFLQFLAVAWIKYRPFYSTSTLSWSLIRNSCIESTCMPSTMYWNVLSVHDSKFLMYSKHIFMRSRLSRSYDDCMQDSQVICVFSLINSDCMLFLRFPTGGTAHNQILPTATEAQYFLRLPDFLQPHPLTPPLLCCDISTLLTFWDKILMPWVESYRLKNHWIHNF